MKNFQLLCDIAEINNTFHHSNDLNSFLQQVVEMIAAHIDVDVCSIYLFNAKDNKLTMRATKGLTMTEGHEITMGLGEGLTGMALQLDEVLIEKEASKNPQFLPIAGINEEPFDCFVAIPLTRGITKIGVMVLQRRTNANFSPDDIKALKAVANQIAIPIYQVKLLLDLNLPKVTEEILGPEELMLDQRQVKAKIASGGFAFGPVAILDVDKSYHKFKEREYTTHYTLEDFEKALKQTQDQLGHLQDRVEEKLSDIASLIFTAHLLILKDEGFIGPIRKLIVSGVNPPQAIIDNAEIYMEIFAHSEDAIIREKVQDLEDLVIRLIGNLVDEERDFCSCKQKVVIAKELFPSDILKLYSEDAAGIVVIGGGITSHLSILSRSLGIPLLITDDYSLMNIQANSIALLDGLLGDILINPSPEVRSAFDKRMATEALSETNKIEAKETTLCRCQTRIHLFANINLLSDAQLAVKNHAEGIGLYRTEFPFMIRANFPSEEEQYYIYDKLMKMFPEKDVTFRTLDIGGDKVLSYYNNTVENNPFLGVRSIRFSLEHKDIFSQQIRAILRAGAGRNIRLMFPMISSIEEFDKSKKIALQCAQDLRNEGVDINDKLAIGMMVEVPSVATIMEDFAHRADFFSIGTNDLIQYILAVDRTNEKVSHLYLPHHPAVLRTIASIVACAQKYHKEISICGDMAHDLHFLPFLLGIGIRDLSMHPVFIPKVQQKLSTIDCSQARQLANQVLAEGESDKILALLQNFRD